ncbi:hypothetical protein FHL15_010040 [Xylaria flabelliformis]|uniref:Uncharacterized protein n=1 Tax=Xylaria flabelliformis TaxID=2512241 RepID=A0A553HM42_9PEZI|nr:hypothetical protein FHL15_010040 [Xylaria flabelliformis]
MRYSVLTTLQILGFVGIHIASAQRLAYASFAVTKCVSDADSIIPNQGSTGPIVNTDPSVDNEHPATITLSYSMPSCISGDCPSCTVLSSFTTAYPAFQTAGASGLTTRSYVVTETYVGVSSLPPFEKPTPIPYGFVTGVETCNLGKCGPEAITATMTYPAGIAPFVGALTPAHGSGCGPGGDTKCSTLSTQFGTSGTSTVLVPAPAQPTAVIAGGNILRGPFEIVIVFVLLIAAP